MGELENRDAVERFFKAADAQDWTTMKELYRPDAIEEWPQSATMLWEEESEAMDDLPVEKILRIAPPLRGDKRSRVGLARGLHQRLRPAG